ncbi:tripartite tricarboxylate transporter substrate binding protein [Bradyrhizobium sp. CCGUVB1N3]|uniref:Bug family tripartite tricarboxylate transporter substrate binding protein n=1 Tax=Bradyrhizobium sp. CCGUVB1N3 TaxID=2949629 RepID=UPI0020B26A1C|nr:tripartite tricarboxylate transporter substrate binding protein [Bradyrhizobium sp. CCGUVB1N3]MCP3473334.1 tripartite tricarboxylate transporter substrate binding protein [Bradyrhizobium sp. CCGUVB1N3]
MIGLFGLFGIAAAVAETFPSKPVTLVIPYSPGGSSDVVGRSLAQKLSEIWKQPVVVENRPGATTTVGAEYVSRAAPDGYTMLLAAPPFVITQYVYPNLGYDTEKNFEPVSLVAYFPLIMVVNPSLPINNLKELIEYSRKNPGMVYPSPGAGTTPHLMGEMLAKHEKLDTIHAPYKSGGQGVIDLVAGRLQFFAGAPAEVMSHMKGGKLRAVAVLDDKRLSVLPDLLTSPEQGFGYLQAQTWSTVVVPKGTPKSIVDKMSGDIATALQDPGLKERLVSQGAVVVGSTPETLRDFYRKEHAKFGPLVKAIGLKPEQ